MRFRVIYANELAYKRSARAQLHARQYLFCSSLAGRERVAAAHVRGDDQPPTTIRHVELLQVAAGPVGGVTESRNLPRITAGEAFRFRLRLLEDLYGLTGRRCPARQQTHALASGSADISATRHGVPDLAGAGWTGRFSRECFSIAF